MRKGVVTVTTLSINDAPDMPRSRRNGLDIPDELMQAVEDSHAGGAKPKKVVVPEQDADDVGKMLRSLRSRHGFMMETTRQKDGEWVTFFFRVTGRREPTNGDDGDGGGQEADTGAQTGTETAEPPAADSPTVTKATNRRRRS